ncbi:guanine nucleotide binding protein, alpha subunit [Auriscalpium vulgare]|uniref:Guanine nucleotide binding protein, alpha subunit n=1 Tax=Auriscalpium vulgare TaxID=40419 RepID=A0ACB8RJW2_9AGAM|nr:guanine nucleotide binding protein, alpha subunit [Auriscalpium vulgare]
MPRLRASSTGPDPLTAWAPPPDASPEDRDARLAREAEAQRVSDEIDAGLREERTALRRRQDVIKVMLLGQSESGKSTTLKNLQMTHAPAAWAAQRESWRIVIQLNLIRSINTILDVLSAVSSSTSPAQPSASSSSRPLSPTYTSDEDASSDAHTALTDHHTDPHALLRLRLAPLRHVEADLQRALGHAHGSHDHDTDRRLREFYVRVRGGQAVRFPHSPTGGSLRHTGSGTLKKGAHDVVAEATDVIAGCADDMKALWHNPAVRTTLAMSGVHLWQHAGFFLDDIDRIATRSYVPSDADVVRARLRTIGVSENHLVFEADAASTTHATVAGALSSASSTTLTAADDHLPRRSRDTAAGSLWARREWIIYDVGGSRTHRQAWLAYFEDLTAVFFLAPISCFDEQLEEDRTVNRLQDSIALWSAVVASPLLARAMMILFLNKYDLLERKIQAGISIQRHLESYDRPNDAFEFTTYIRRRFERILRKKSPVARPFYGYHTSAIDTTAMAHTLTDVREGVIRRHLEEAQFI